MVLTYTILLALFRRELLPQMKSEFLPGLLQFENWWHIFKFNPAENLVSPLGFLWALSVMVQLLVIWSLILWCINRFLPDERIYILAPAGLAFISFLLFAILYKQEDPARALYGTDTRAFSFLLGLTPFHIIGKCNLRNHSTDRRWIQGCLSVKRCP